MVRPGVCRTQRVALGSKASQKRRQREELQSVCVSWVHDDLALLAITRKLDYSWIEK